MADSRRSSAPWLTRPVRLSATPASSSFRPTGPAGTPSCPVRRKSLTIRTTTRR